MDELSKAQYFGLEYMKSEEDVDISIKEIVYANAHYYWLFIRYVVIGNYFKKMIYRIK